MPYEEVENLLKNHTERPLEVTIYKPGASAVSTGMATEPLPAPPAEVDEPEPAPSPAAEAELARKG